MKIRIFCLLLSVLLIISFTGCGQQTNSGTPAAEETKAESAAKDEPKAEPAKEAAEEPKTEEAPAAADEPNLDQASGGEKEVVFWNLWGGGDGEVLTKMVEEFNSTNPDGIKVISLTQDWGQYYTKLRTAAMGGQAPDLAMSHVTRVLELQTNSIIQPMDKALEASGINVDWNNFTSGVMDNCRVDGKYYAMPVDNLVLVTFYNKDILVDCGLLDADGNADLGSDYATFIGNLNKIKEKGYTPLVAGQKGFLTQGIWYSIYKQMGGPDMLSADLKSVTYDTDLAIKAAEYEKEIYSFTPPMIEDVGKYFAEGKTALCFDGSWSTAYIAGLIGESFGVTKFPKLFEQDVAWSDSHAFVLPNKPERNADKTKMSLSFAKWFSDNNWKWAEAGHLPANKSTWESPEFKANTMVASYKDAGNNSFSFPSTLNVWLTFAPEMYDHLEKMINEGASPQDTINAMTDNLNSALSK